MYSVSDDYLTAIAENSRTISWYGTVTLEDGTTVYNFDVSNIVQSGFSITSQICSQDALEIGTTGSTELKLTLMLEESDGTYYLDGTTVDRYAFYNATVEMYFRLYLTSSTYEDVPMGIFTVTEPSRTKKFLTLDCFDNMVFFNADAKTLGSDTPYNLIAYICSDVGVTLGTTQAEIEAMANGTSTFKISSVANITTWRQALGQIATALGAVAVVGRDGYLYIKEYSTTLTRSIGTDFRYSLDVADYEAYYTQISAYSLSDGETLTITNSTDGSLYEVGTNGFIQSDVSTFITNILSTLSTITYTPFDAELVGDPSLECLDVLEFTGGQAESGKYAAITSIVYNYGSMEVKCAGENPKTTQTKSSSASTLSNLTQTKGDMTFYQTTNSSAYTVGSTAVELATIEFIASSATWLSLNAEIKYTGVTKETVSASNDHYYIWDMTVSARIYVNDEEQDFVVVQTETDGVNTIHINHPLSVSEGGVVVTIALECDYGTATVAAGDVQMFVVGEGLVDREFVGISVAQEPTVTNYAYVELDYTGLVVRGTYNDGTYIDVTDDCIFDPTEGTIIEEEGETTVTVTYGSYTTTFTLDLEIPNFLSCMNYTEDDTTITITGTSSSVYNTWPDTIVVPSNYNGKTVIFGDTE